MKRLLLGIFTALILAMAGGTLPASAAPSTPAHGPGRGTGGQVTAVSGTTITVKTPQGSATIVTTASTTFELERKAASLSDIKVGLYVHAEGTKGSDGVLTATRVSASATAPQAGTTPKGRPTGRGTGGQVTAVGGTTITVKTPQGSATIVTTASTTFELERKAASLSDIKVGLYVHAEGTKGSDGVLTATRVSASATAPQRPAQR